MSVCFLPFGIIIASGLVNAFICNKFLYYKLSLNNDQKSLTANKQLRMSSDAVLNARNGSCVSKHWKHPTCVFWNKQTFTDLEL